MGKNGRGNNKYLFVKENFRLFVNFTKLISTLTASFKAVLQILFCWLKVNLFPAMQFKKDTKLKVCITGDRGSNRGISLFLGNI